MTVSTAKATGSTTTATNSNTTATGSTAMVTGSIITAKVSTTTAATAIVSTTKVSTALMTQTTTGTSPLCIIQPKNCRSNSNTKMLKCCRQPPLTLVPFTGLDTACKATKGALKAFNTFTLNKQQRYGNSLGNSILFESSKVKKVLGKKACFINCYLKQKGVMSSEYVIDTAKLTDFLTAAQIDATWRSKLASAISDCLSIFDSLKIPDFTSKGVTCPGKAFLVVQCVHLKAISSCPQKVETKKCQKKYDLFNRCSCNIFKQQAMNKRQQIKKRVKSGKIVKKVIENVGNKLTIGDAIKVKKQKKKMVKSKKVKNAIEKGKKRKSVKNGKQERKKNFTANKKQEVQDENNRRKHLKQKVKAEKEIVQDEGKSRKSNKKSNAKGDGKKMRQGERLTKMKKKKLGKKSDASRFNYYA
ncbi:uncharacterized protein LOC132195700 [Neocloeon triangulifer]|uniref:uncharacterized protein LOC132195700 n=1 Tax=Neocloeon triangulifer TaxID=2078957 RepID=UPI00286F8AE6|nr:uncharacterized protein LOC132195700 [Neocloeon triangulifer]